MTAPIRQAELAIAWVLRGGVALAGTVIAAGLFSRIFHLVAVQGQSRELIATLLSGRTPDNLAVSASTLLEGIKSFNPDSVMALGLLILIALPVIRVAMTVVLFLVERDYVYLLITLIVLIVLLLGLFFGYSL